MAFCPANIFHQYYYNIQLPYPKDKKILIIFHPKDVFFAVHPKKKVGA